MEKIFFQSFRTLSRKQKVTVIAGSVVVLIFVVWHLFFRIDFSRTVYIDRSVRTSGNGSFARPIKNLETVLSLYNIKKRHQFLDIVIAGKHEGDFMLPIGTRMQGIDGGVTTISGTLTLPVDVTVRKLRITGEGPGIRIINGSDVVLEDIDVSENTDTGIDAGDETKVEISRSRITNNAGKGISVGTGSNIIITQSEVKSNQKEGIDFEGGVNGTVTDSTISYNKESGIEYTLGQSIGIITGNTISQNDASGITVQFYDKFPLLGNVRIENNTISQNDDFGIACAKPGGGNKPVRYYDNATTVNNNVVSGNDNDPIAKKCGFDL